MQLLLRLHISHVLQVCSRYTADRDAGVPARGLNGEAYRGHVFWDELYVYPFLNFRLPDITRALLMYRFRRLGEARAAAREAGYRGAMYPVAERQRRQGGDPGRPPQPAVGPWEPDLSHNQRHVNAAIFYNVWQLLPGHRGPRLPARVRRRDDARDRALLGVDRAASTPSATATRSTA